MAHQHQDIRVGDILEVNKNRTKDGWSVYKTVRCKYDIAIAEIAMRPIEMPGNPRCLWRLKRDGIVVAGVLE